MQVARGKSELFQQLNTLSYKNKTIGFVPTMGALHQGHMHLVNRASDENDISICSIYVNPTQFNDPADFEKYPRNDENDIELLRQTGADIAYFPIHEELYPTDKDDLIDYEDDSLFSKYEGEFRPGHFKGVVTVVMRLFEQIGPKKAYFGLKDYQQYLVVKKATPHFFNNIDIVGVPTVRSESGLALSSRNKRLNEEELKNSLAISKALHYLKEQRSYEELEQALKNAKAIIGNSGLDLEYLDVCEKNNLMAVNQWQEVEANVAVCAAFMGPVRLIDNLIF